MKYLSLQIILVLQLIPSDVRSADPCTTHEVLNDVTRSATREWGRTEAEHCDRYIKDAWYAFQDPSPTDMPTECIPVLRCGSTAPIWINGSLPKTLNEVKKVQACKRGFTSCCIESFDIEVQNCGTFNVYHLVPIKKCNGRFCTVGAARCQPGTTSESGYEPCRKVTITFYVKPTITPIIPSYIDTSPDRQLAFKCEGNYVSYRLYYFDIKYLIDGTEVRTKTSNLTYSELFTTGLFRKSDWIMVQPTLGFKVKCLIRVKQSVGSLPSEWKESEDFYAGIKVLTPLLSVVAGGTANIQITSTVPIACPTVNGMKIPCVLRFEMLDFIEEGNDACNRSEATKPSACGLEMMGWEWNSITTMAVSTLSNPRFQSDYSAIIRLKCTTSTSDNLWEELHVPDVKVLIRNPITQRYNAHCSSHGDPHLSTSDGSTYNHYGTGEFVLYAHKTKPIAVHVIHQPIDIFSGYAVNCAIAIQAASDVFIIYGCEERNKWVIRRLNCEQSHGAYLDIFERNEGKEYEVHLPTGSRVLAKIQSPGYIDIDVYPSTSELGNSQGLCGYFNGNIGDDYMDRNGRIVSISEFQTEWSVNPIDSLFVAKARTEKISRPFFFCKCLHDSVNQEDLTKKADCSWKESYSLCQTQSWSEKQCQFRHKRDLQSDRLDDELEEFDVPVEKVVFNPSPPNVDLWKNGWNVSSATDYCTKILHSSEMYQKCKSLSHLSDSISVDNCVGDIKVSGTTLFAEQSTYAYKSACVNEVRLNSSLWTLNSPTSGGTLLEDIVHNDCPSECSLDGKSRGNCVKGVCHCFNGYSGDDCSVDVTQPPTVVGTFTGSICDLTKALCAEIPVFGSNFHKSLSLQCKIKEQDLNTTDSIQTTTHMMRARMASFSEVKCPLPEAVRNRKRRSSNVPIIPQGFFISVTTNGIAFSNEIPVLIFDSSCSECSILQGKFMSCKQRNNICVVNNKCYSISNSICGNTIAESKDEYTKHNMLWIIGAVLGATTLLVILFVVTVKIKFHKRTQTANSTADLYQNSIYQASKSTKYP